MNHTLLNSLDLLPLTCSRRGSCCFGKQVLLNPWELATLSLTKGISIQEFSKEFCEFGGTKMLFNGALSARGEKACSQYKENFGCTLHTGRPLVCRLYPIGRSLQNNQVNYIYEGEEFPCMRDCSEVTDLPQMTVEEYLKGQQTEQFEKAQDLYLELMLGIADIAFTLFLETGLNESEKRNILSEWTTLKESTTEDLYKQMNSDWLNLITKPEIAYKHQAEEFIKLHSEYIQEKVQLIFEGMDSGEKITETSIHVFASALLLAYSLGMNIREIGDHWISIARNNMNISDH